MEDLDTQLRPLAAVLARVNAAIPGIGANISLYQIDGVERPVVVVFDKPWVVWLYIDAGNFMLRGGCPSDRVRQLPCRAAIAVGRVGTAAYDVPAKIIDMARQLAAGVPEQPADKYTWIAAGGYVSQMEGKYAPLSGHFMEMLAPLINRLPIRESLGRIELPEPEAVTAPSLPHLPASPTTPTSGQHAVPPESPRLVHVADETAENVRPAGTPKLERPGLIPGIAGATALLLAVLPLEYALYGLIRWVVCVSAIWLVTVAARHKVYGWMCGYAIVAILWNPLLPFEFSRASWLMPDLIGAGMMAFGAYALVSHHPEPSEL